MTAFSVPESVQLLTNRLETAGFPTYAVGGCVRDMILGLAPHDYDLCTAARPEQTAEIFSDHHLVLAGQKHGTVGVITGHEMVEITTFRQEGGYQDNRHPDWVKFMPRVEDDLARRDFTINAMAWSQKRGFSDPFGGQEDLKNHILRAVGEPATRFREDALRILRGIRFSIRYHLTPEEKTLEAMIALAPLTDHLARERVFDELCKLLPLVTAQDLLTYAPILCRVLPPLAPTLGFQQHNYHHIHDVYTHTAHVTAAVPPDLALRWAALLHDIGKPSTFSMDEDGVGHFPDHARVGADLADELLRQLHAPTALRERVVWLIVHHMTPLEPDRKLLRRRISRWGWDKVNDLFDLQQADFCSKGTKTKDSEESYQFMAISEQLDELRQEESMPTLQNFPIDGHDLLQLGFAPGPALGRCLHELLSLVIQEQLPNDRQALLEAAAQRLEQP